jgi:hypothetical protein
MRIEMYRMHMVRGEHGRQYFKFIVVRNPFVRQAGQLNPAQIHYKELKQKY